MKKFVLAVLIILLGFGFAFADFEKRKAFDFTAPVPKPHLLAPVKEEVDLTGKRELEFKWSAHEQGVTFRQYYDFRLYKGYNENQGSLIYKKKLPSNVYQIKLPSKMFKNGEAYTWRLRQVYSPEKSPWSYYSFKVIKK